MDESSQSQIAGIIPYANLFSIYEYVMVRIHPFEVKNMHIAEIIFTFFIEGLLSEMKLHICNDSSSNRSIYTKLIMNALKKHIYPSELEMPFSIIFVFQLLAFANYRLQKKN